MENLKIARGLMVIGILSAFLMSCSGGGGSSQGNALGTAAQKEKKDPGTGGGNDDDDSDSSNGRGEGDHNDHNGGSNDTSDIPVSTAVNSQQLSTVVFAPGQSQFLVVWNDLRNRSSFDYYGWAVYGQFVNGLGAFEGHNFPISPLGVEYRTTPSVAHDAATVRSLVVWEVANGGIHGRLINSDGTFFSSLLSIATASTHLGEPALTFNPIHGKYLVVWLGSSNDYPIYGQLIDREGNLAGTPFLISDVSSGKMKLQATYDIQNGRTLVVWRDDRGMDLYSIRGQLINIDGTRWGDEIIIADAPGSQNSPALAYDSVNHCFLVTWSDDRRFGGAYYEIYGQLVASDGVPMSSNFFISSYGGYSHALDFDPSNAHYFLTFSKFGARIHGQYIAADGLARDEAVALSDLEATQGAPHLAYDSGARRFLAAWTDHRNGSSDIYGRTTAIALSQDPCDGQNDLNLSGCLQCETDAGARVDQACPVNASYTGHGAYVDCVTKAVNALRKAGQISAACALKLVDPRARSGVGE